MPLRKLGGRLGCERLVLKGGRMTMYFPADKEHPFYRSDVFDRVIQYAMSHFKTCRLSEDAGRRRMTVRPVASVRQALETLSAILPPAGNR